MQSNVQNFVKKIKFCIFKITKIEFCKFKITLSSKQKLVKYLEGDQGDKEVNNSVDQVKYCSWEAKAC